MPTRIRMACACCCLLAPVVGCWEKQRPEAGAGLEQSAGRAAQAEVQARGTLPSEPPEREQGQADPERERAAARELKLARAAAEEALAARRQRQAQGPFADTRDEDRRLGIVRQRLREIIAAYSDTQAAREAERLLEELRQATIPCPPYRIMPHAR